MIYKFITEDKKEALEMEYSDQLVGIVNNLLKLFGGSPAAYLFDKYSMHISFPSGIIQGIAHSIAYMEILRILKEMGFDISEDNQLIIPDDIGC